ncbi:hypothetical protein MNBD_NITROSPINAE05-167 [hydrothermal vent metagenome]|uniref:Uncharacterized protein n=1 Tax=hydrothermal vent metagenome TaxID=652676 RepID=A0A3B1DLS6_9ZZZZ
MGLRLTKFGFARKFFDCHCEQSEATQRPWVYPYGARKLRSIITATPLIAARDDEFDDSPRLISTAKVSSRFPSTKGASSRVTGLLQPSND